MTTSTLKAGIIGAAGYTGGTLLRLLLQHPYVHVAYAHSTTYAGMPVTAVHQDLLGETELLFSNNGYGGADVVFLCLPHGKSREFLTSANLPDSVSIIDLSNDFRLAGQNEYVGRHFTYGLPELNRSALQNATAVANPGCFATAIVLGLLPLARVGHLTNVYTTGITGSTGAGQQLSATSHFSWRSGNIQAYKTLRHQHLPEVRESLQTVAGSGCPAIHFIPWRGNFTRGIFVSSQLQCEMAFHEISSLYADFYRDHPFTVVSSDAIHLKQVVNTNKCVIQLEHVESQLVVHTAIDNLIKGASGQAVQNMNLMFGLPETSGLKLLPVAL